MINVLIALAALQAAPAPHTSAPPTPEAVVQSQLDAYNAHDLDAFAATYADTVQIFRHPGQPMLQGRAALRALYGPLFQAGPKARLVHRQVLGDQVADVEAITLGGREHCCALAIYKVEGGLITRVDFVAAADFMAGD
jgi:hypothetical protein